MIQHDYLAHQGDIRNLRVEPLAAHRGVIRDRAGKPLAVSTPVVTLWVNPREAMEHQDQWGRPGRQPGDRPESVLPAKSAGMNPASLSIWSVAWPRKRPRRC